ncbi:MAG: hypothetical protein ABUL42_04180 [Terricaulis silvestris]
MQTALLRLATALMWPVTIWTSLIHFDEHPADDYVQRTTPIVASAIGFWLCALGLVALAFLMQGRILNAGAEDSGAVLRISDPRWEPLMPVATLVGCVLYAVGLWLFMARAERFPQPRAH